MFSLTWNGEVKICWKPPPALSSMVVEQEAVVVTIMANTDNFNIACFISAYFPEERRPDLQERFSPAVRSFSLASYVSSQDHAPTSYDRNGAYSCAGADGGVVADDGGCCPCP